MNKTSAERSFTDVLSLGSKKILIISSFSFPFICFSSEGFNVMALPSKDLHFFTLFLVAWMYYLEVGCCETG